MKNHLIKAANPRAPTAAAGLRDELSRVGMSLNDERVACNWKSIIVWVAGIVSGCNKEEVGGWW